MKKNDSMGFSKKKRKRPPVKKTSIACLAGKKKITPSGWCLACDNLPRRNVGDTPQK